MWGKRFWQPRAITSTSGSIVWITTLLICQTCLSWCISSLSLLLRESKTFQAAASYKSVLQRSKTEGTNWHEWHDMTFCCSLSWTRFLVVIASDFTTWSMISFATLIDGRVIIILNTRLYPLTVCGQLCFTNTKIRLQMLLEYPAHIGINWGELRVIQQIW